MTKEQAHYYADRLLRAHVRGDDMSDAQRKDLHEEIQTTSPPEDIAKASEAMLTGSLTDDSVTALYKTHKVNGFDLEAHRTARAAGESASSVRDARLTTLLNG